MSLTQDKVRFAGREAAQFVRSRGGKTIWLRFNDLGEMAVAKQNSFDIVSEVDLAEVKNAVNQALKETSQRYDLKGSDSDIVFNEADKTISLTSRDEFTRKAVQDILGTRLMRRKVPLQALTYGDVLPAAKDTVRQIITLQQGIPTEKAREIVKLIKKEKLKVQAAIQEDMVRVSGKDRDTLQAVIAVVKAADLGIDTQFTNFRS